MITTASTVEAVALMLLTLLVLIAPGGSRKKRTPYKRGAIQPHQVVFPPAPYGWKWSIVTGATTSSQYEVVLEVVSQMPKPRFGYYHSISGRTLTQDKVDLACRIILALFRQDQP